jgi:hypothetical protein
MMVHTHRHGVDYKIITSDLAFIGGRDKEAVIAMLNIDFEPDRGETIEFLDITDAKPVKIKDKDVQKKIAFLHGD